MRRLTFYKCHTVLELPAYLSCPSYPSQVSIHRAIPDLLEISNLPSPSTF